MDNTETTFNQLKEKYSSLASFTYDSQTQTLSYNGMSIDVSSVNFDEIDSVFYGLPASELYIFLKQKFYKDIRNEIDNIKSAIETKSIISNEDIKYFKNLIGLRHSWCMKNSDFLNANYNSSVHIQRFINELMEGCKLIKDNQNIMSQEAPKSNGYVINVDTINNNSVNEQNAVDVVEQVNEPAFTLTRNKPGEPGYKYEDDKINSISGYASIVLLVLTSVLLATYIVATLIG